MVYDGERWWMMVNDGLPWSFLMVRFYMTYSYYRTLGSFVQDPHITIINDISTRLSHHSEACASELLRSLEVSVHSHKKMYHGILLMYHGTVTMYHGTSAMYHGTLSMYHCTLPIYYGTFSYGLALRTWWYVENIETVNLKSLKLVVPLLTPISTLSMW